MVDMAQTGTIAQPRQTAPTAATRDTRPSRRRLLKRGALAAALLAATAAAGNAGYDYWRFGQYLETTDDAYVQADYTIVAPKVAGIISDVLVRDNQPVAAGQILARIDDRDFCAALAQAQAGVAAAHAAIGNLDAQMTLQQSVIDQARAAVAATEARLTFARQDAARYRELVRTGTGIVQRAQQAQAASDQAAAQLKHDQAAVAGALDKVAVLQTARRQAEAGLARARAALRQAALNLSYTTITAPVAGTVGARTLRVGQYVGAGTQLMAVVPLNAAYVVANFKETQLTRVRRGQAVTLSVDSYPGVTLTGHVDSLAPASGLEFALLPPDNATGNFTKIVQRIPVRIALDPSSLTGLLRAGMSVEPTIDTKATTPSSSHAG